MQVIGTDTLYTFTGTQAREILYRCTMYPTLDTMLQNRMATVDSLVVRISTTDSIVAIQYGQLTNQDGQIQAYKQLLQLTETETTALQQFIHTALADRDYHRQAHHWWRGVGMGSILLNITLLLLL